jgi:hypothetical protein
MNIQTELIQDSRRRFRRLESAAGGKGGRPGGVSPYEFLNGFPRNDSYVAICPAVIMERIFVS